MLVKDEQQAVIDIGQMLDTDGFSHQARSAIAPLVVHALGHAGSAPALLAGPVLPGAEEGAINVVLVGIDQFLSVFSGNAPPELLETFFASVADKVSDHLPGEAAHSDPEIAELTLPAEADKEFIDLDGVIPYRLYEALGQLCLLRFF